MINFGRTVNQVVIPELSEQIILQTVAKAEQEFKENKRINGTEQPGSIFSKVSNGTPKPE